MADWSGLRDALAVVPDRVTYAWADLDALVGGLPPSAYEHRAFWSGTRSMWPGFRAIDVHVGDSVTFIRVGAGAAPQSAAAASRADAEEQAADVILISCAKPKLAQAAPARELYTSALFRKERAYAEAAAVPWFILSAKHELVDPDTVLEPYDLNLSTTTSGYRHAWGTRVVEQLATAVGALDTKVIEVRAGTTYVNAIRGGLEAAGATVIEPLEGPTMGQRLAWHTQPRIPPNDTTPPDATPDVTDLAEQLTDTSRARTPEQFLATGGAGLQAPGLYSWWMDRSGAHDLTHGLGHPIEPGLIYAGLAGATRSRSRRKSSNTLWGRISSMHLGGNHNLSTFRRSLGSILDSATGLASVDEGRLTSWMHQHLRVITVPVSDADTLNEVETAVLTVLNPPLNLAKMPGTATRTALRKLRRAHSRT